MKPIKILHFADVHLGSDFRSLGRKAAARRSDLKETFLEIIKLCKENEIELLLAVGDLFDRWNISEEYFQLVRDGFSEIFETTVVISAGNHDPLSPDSAYLRENFWSNNVIIMPTQFDSILLDHLSTEVWGGSFASSYAYSTLFKDVKPKKANYLQIGAIHGTVGSKNQISEYNPISTVQIASSGLTYLALGHIHKPSGTQSSGATQYAYPGCPEGRGFDELGERGVLMGEVSKNLVNLQFVPISRRMHLEVAADLSSATGTKNASEFILSQLKESYPENFEHNLYKIYLEGKVPDSINMDSIKASLGELFYVKLRDRTEIDIDLGATAKEISLKGIFVRRMLEELKNNDSPEVREALKLGLKSFLGKVDYSED